MCLHGILIIMVLVCAFVMIPSRDRTSTGLLDVELMLPVHCTAVIKLEYKVVLRIMYAVF